MRSKLKSSHHRLKHNFLLIRKQTKDFKNYSKGTCLKLLEINWNLLFQITLRNFRINFNRIEKVQYGGAILVENRI